MEKKDKPKDNSIGQLVEIFMEAALILLVLAAVLSFKYLKNNPETFREWKTRSLVMVFGSLSAFGLSLMLLAYYLKSTVPAYSYICLLIFGFWSLSGGAVIAGHRLLIDTKTPPRITTKALRKTATKFERLIPMLQDRMTMPIGVSLTTNKPFFLPIPMTLEHILICGATGVGKTSTLITMLLHCMKNNLPAIVIDPKGELADIELIKELATLVGRDKDLLVFSLSNPQASCSYDFIKLGTPEQRKSKLMAGFGLTHEHYGSLAAKVLGTLFDVVDYFNEHVDIKKLERLLNSNNERRILEDRLNNEPESQEVNDLIAKMASIRKLSSEDISGLVAAAEVYGLREFRGVFTPKTSTNPEIDIVDILQNGKIAYFQLNTNGYGDLAHRFGKLLVQDIALVSSMIQTRQITRKYEYAGIFIDEFGSFVSTNFSNIQKMIRSAHMGLRLFYQGMADLRTISQQFEDQVMGNTIVKIILRQDVDDDSKKWSATAGTVDAIIHSFQTETGLVGQVKTGTGNIHEGKKVKIEFDVFKELGKGQAVVIDKGRKIQDVIQIWDAKNPSYIDKLRLTAVAPKVSTPRIQATAPITVGASTAHAKPINSKYHTNFRSQIGRKAGLR